MQIPPAGYIGTLNCHSHPYIGDLRPSESDINLANLMYWQDEFLIVTPDMKKTIYTKGGVLYIEDVRESITPEKMKILDELFGGNRGNK